jgi:rsbT co-antagonist protein RsbR
LNLLVDLLRLDYWSLNNAETPQHEAIHTTLSDLTESRTGLGFSAIETAAYIYSLKDSLLLFLQETYGTRAKQLNEAIIQVSRLVDRLGLMAFDIFNERSQRLIRQQQQEILELSTPVIHMWEGILVVPLVGTLDSVRAQQVMENLLHEIADTGYDVVILDIAGVSTVDTLVAQYLLKTISAARLMGAECIISGISPAIAQTIVQLGIDLPAVKTTSTLAGALKAAFKMLNLEVSRQ